MNLLCRVKRASEEKGLLLNTKKTKIMVMDRDRTSSQFLLDGQKVDEVQQFKITFTIKDVHHMATVLSLKKM